jgi:hypothetical protein
MTTAQSRLAENLSSFYDAADRTSEGAMAAHAYKQSVNELEQGIGRELVRVSAILTVADTISRLHRLLI